MKSPSLCRFPLLFTASLLWLGFAGCSHPLPSLTWSLPGTVWMLTELDNAAVGAEKLPTLQLDAATGQASGFGGLNRFTGPATLKGPALTFGPLAMTRMAGPPAQMQIEARYSQMLGTVTAWQIDGPILSLFAGKEVVARFRATPAQP